MSAKEKWNVCSCIREKDFLSKEIHLCKCNDNPRSGDIVLVQIKNDKNGYSQIENQKGRHIDVYEGVSWVCVLGNRNSGTNVNGKVPNEKICQGDTLALLAQGGIVGQCLWCDEKQRNGQPLEVKVIGFIADSKNTIINIDNIKKNVCEPAITNVKPTFVVFGTSAESGKTTLVKAIVRELKKGRNVQVGCLKVCGTGRLKDKLAYEDEGADICMDFVDAGLVSTYGVSKENYMQMVNVLYKSIIEKCDVVIIEVGGDLLEGGAEYFIQVASEYKFNKILMANDAMGAMMGIKLLGDNTTIFSWRQNIFALRNRLSKEEIFGVTEKGISQYLAKNR